MEFVFIDEAQDEDDETLDISDLTPKKKTAKKDSRFNFIEDIPAPKSLADPKVKNKARESRQSKPRTFDDKMSSGWSYMCAHKEHLPNLCEREQERGQVSCSCPCHPERGFVLSEPESLHRSDEQEIVLTID